MLRPGGALLLTIPFLWPEHEQPWDSQRFTCFGLQRRLEASGFRVERMLKLNPGLSALLHNATPAGAPPNFISIWCCWQ